MASRVFLVLGLVLVVQSASTFANWVPTFVHHFEMTSSSESSGNGVNIFKLLFHAEKDSSSPPLLPPDFQSTVYLEQGGNSSHQKVHYYYDSVNQRFAVYGWETASGVWNVITLCSHGVEYDFNDSVCSHRTVKCNVSRQILPPDSSTTLIGTFNIGEQSTPKPVQLWSSNVVDGIYYMVESSTGTPISLQFSGIAEFFGDVHRPVDPNKFVPPHYCF